MKSEVDKLGINNLINVSASLNNLEMQVDNLHVGKLKTVHVDLKSLSDIVHKQVVKNTKGNTLKRKVSEVSILIHINQQNTDKQKFDKKWRC